jgi:hypothetical protein
MAKAIDKVRAGFTAAKRQITVPEFADESGPLELWFSRLTTADLQAVVAREPKDNLDQDLMLLIHKALDADGKPAFQMGDLHYLRTEADYLVLRRIIAFMYDSTAIVGDGAVRTTEVEEAAKQIAEDPSSASA